MGMKKLFSVLVLSAFVATSSMAKHPTPNKPRYASDVLMDSYKYIDSLKHFKIKAHTTNDDLYRNQIVMQLNHDITIEIQRPDKMYIDISGDVKNQKIYLDNSLYTIYSKRYNLYAQINAKPTIDETLDMVFDRYNIKTALANLLYSDLEKRLKPLSKGYYFGLVKLDGVLCDYLGFKNRYKEFQVWIEHGKQPLIKKFVIIDKTTKQRLRSESTIEWDLNPFSFFSVFKFTPSANSVQIDILP